MDIFEAGLQCAHTLSSQKAWPPSAPQPLSEFCIVAAETTPLSPLTHSKRETGQLRRVSAASKTAQRAAWHQFPLFQVSAGTEAENWPLEAPLAELSEFMKTKQNKTRETTAPKKSPLGCSCAIASDLFQGKVTIFVE